MSLLGVSITSSRNFESLNVCPVFFPLVLNGAQVWSSSYSLFIVGQNPNSKNVPKICVLQSILQAGELFSCFILKSIELFFELEIRAICRLLLEISLKVDKRFPVSS